MTDPPPFDPRCGRFAADMPELDDPRHGTGYTRAEYVRAEEGTFNPAKRPLPLRPLLYRRRDAHWPQRVAVPVRLHGFCTTCHRFRLVTARDVDAALAVMRRGIAPGTCDTCDTAAEVDRRIAEHRRRG